MIYMASQKHYTIIKQIIDILYEKNESNRMSSEIFSLSEYNTNIEELNLPDT
jgi:hypothetical protein